jgi:hypothetical protein
MAHLSHQHQYDEYNKTISKGYPQKASALRCMTTPDNK